MNFAKPPVVWVETGNFGYPQGIRGRNGQPVIGICYHIAEGSRGSVESWFRSPKSQASSHFLVCRDGAVVQFVAEEDAAWTQGDVQGATWPLYDRRINPNLVLLGVEHEGYHDEPWTEPMFEADVALTLHLCERFAIAPRRPYLLGHDELNAKSRRNCPGPHFPWPRLLDEVQRRYVKRLIPWMAEAVSQGLALGLTDGSRPLDLALRGEAMAVYVRVLERLQVPPRGQDPGSVAPEAPDWMRPWIRKAMQYGISDGTRPLEPALRGEAMAMAVRTLDKAIDGRKGAALTAPETGPAPPATPLPEPSDSSAPPDQPVPAWQEEVDRARQEGISDGTRPQESALRGEVVAMAVRAMARLLPG